MTHATPEKRRAYEKKRAQDPARKALAARLALRNREARRLYAREYYRKNRVQILAKEKANPRNLLRGRARRLGVSVPALAAFLASEPNVCRTCGAPPGVSKYSKLHVDHCHKTGKLRGLLCRGCNTSLGLTNENPATLRALADYLERHA